MTDQTATLHMLCGKIASGKSTLAARLAKRPGTILIAEDDWLSALFGDRMQTGQDFVEYSSRLRSAIGPHVSALLKSGLSVVLDFQANTVQSRNWMRGLLDGTGAAQRLHLLDVPDEVCLERLKARNARTGHPFATTEEQFHRFSRHFQPPSPEEGFEVVLHPVDE